jgi:hypothetical protein
MTVLSGAHLSCQTLITHEFPLSCLNELLEGDSLFLCVTKRYPSLRTSRRFFLSKRDITAEQKCSFSRRHVDAALMFVCSVYSWLTKPTKIRVFFFLIPLHNICFVWRMWFAPVSIAQKQHSTTISDQSGGLCFSLLFFFFSAATPLAYPPRLRGYRTVGGKRSRGFSTLHILKLIQVYIRHATSHGLRGLS